MKTTTTTDAPGVEPGGIETIMSTTQTKPLPFHREKREDKFTRAMRYAVHGFWPSDSVRVTQARDYRDGWKSPEVDWSCGGRSPKTEPDDLVAAECFAKAVTDAVRVARRWKKKPPTSK